MPDGRTQLYAIWRACERFGVLPPNIKSSWDDMLAPMHMELIAYDQVRQIEELKYDASLAGAKLI